MKVKCPTCKKWTEWQNNPHKPFCSQRCKLIDLGAWASETYKIPCRVEDDPLHTRSEREREND